MQTPASALFAIASGAGFDVTRVVGLGGETLGFRISRISTGERLTPDCSTLAELEWFLRGIAAARA